MSKNTSHIESLLYNPKFSIELLKPKYWGSWLVILISSFFAFLSPKTRRPIARWLAKKIVKLNGGAVKRARINLNFCFPDKSEDERNLILQDCFYHAAQYLLGFAELLFRPTKRNQARCNMLGKEHLAPALASDENVILLTPHTWCIDYPAVILASEGQKVVGMIKPQKNKLTEWLMHKQRMQYGGRIFPKSAGIKPFMKSIREGYIGYWLPDEDHGEQNSVFAPFFGEQKATLKGFGKMAKLSKAQVVPVISTYNDKTEQFDIQFYPKLENFPSGDELEDAKILNTQLEAMIRGNEAHYMWNLYLFQTRPNGERNPYWK